MNRVLAVDARARTALVQPGAVLDDLRDAAEHHHLTFGPDPATHTHCTLGGMIGNNSCGVHSILAGRTSENVLALEILTYDGVRMWVGPTDQNSYDVAVVAGDRVGEIYSALAGLRDRGTTRARRSTPQAPA